MKENEIKNIVKSCEETKTTLNARTEEKNKSSSDKLSRSWDLWNCKSSPAHGR